MASRALAQTPPAYLVTGAQLAAPKDVDSTTRERRALNLLWDAHELVGGTKSVLVIRELVEGNGPDDGKFFFLTVELPGDCSNEEREFPLAAQRLYLSTGSRAWISRGAGVFANAGSGILLCRMLSPEKAEISVRGAFIGQPASTAFNHSDEPIRIDRNHQAQLISLKEATKRLPAMTKRQGPVQ